MGLFAGNTAREVQPLTYAQPLQGQRETNTTGARVKIHENDLTIWFRCKEKIEQLLQRAASLPSDHRDQHRIAKAVKAYKVVDPRLLQAQ